MFVAGLIVARLAASRLAFTRFAAGRLLLTRLAASGLIGTALLVGVLFFFLPVLARLLAGVLLPVILFSLAAALGHFVVLARLRFALALRRRFVIAVLALGAVLVVGRRRRTGLFVGFLLALLRLGLAA